MKDLSQKFRGSLPPNTRKKEDSHPDFTAKLTVWNTVYSAAAWFGITRKGDRYISLHLTSDGDESQIEKIKLALWRNHDHQDSAGPHFRSTQSIYGRDFALKAWLVPADDNYQLGVTIEPVDKDWAEVSDAALETRERIATFLAEIGGEVAAFARAQSCSALTCLDRRKGTRRYPVLAPLAMEEILSNGKESLRLKLERSHYCPNRDKKRTRARGWILAKKLTDSPKAEAVRADILDRLLQHEREDTLPRGGRGLFYDLRPNGIPGNPRGVTYTKVQKDKRRGNMQATPGYVTDMLAEMRRVWNPDTETWLIPEHWIADGRSPDPINPSEVESADEAARIVTVYLENLWLARQAGQEICLEIQCEAADLMSRIARVATPYGVTVYSGGGMDGLKGKKAVARRTAGREVPTLIGHLADRDDSGDNIRDAFAEDAIAFARWHQEFESSSGSIDIVRLGLTREQAEAHDLLDDDGKAELDGLPVPVLDAIVREFIESHMDLEILERVKRAEPKMRAEAAKIALQLLKRSSPPNT